jgi:hypothetical protein
MYLVWIGETHTGSPPQSIPAGFFMNGAGNAYFLTFIFWRQYANFRNLRRADDFAMSEKKAGNFARAALVRSAEIYGK